MVTDRTQKRLPPYVSYRTFRNFVDGLQQGVPARIDRSYWGDNFSGSTGTQLVAALRFLGLVDGENVPTARLKMLVFAKSAQRGDVLKQMSNDAYYFLGQSAFDPQTATYDQLTDCFKNTFQLAGDVNRKCCKFYIGLASDAGIPLSPFILKRSKTISSSPGPKTPRKPRRGTIRPAQIPEDDGIVPEGTSWDKALIDKFPTLDPAWPDDIKLKWFEGFGQLLKLGHDGK